MRPLLLSFAVALGVGCSPSRERPDVVIVTIDTLRADAVGFMGQAEARTPVVDSLASSGTVFTRATTPMPRTTPGVGSLLTGLWPHHHGSREVGNPLREVETLAQILRRAGYLTLGVSSNPAASRRQRVDRGFDRWLGPSDLAAEAQSGAGRPGWATTRGVRNLLGDADPRRPLFLWVLYFDPHFPYLPPSPWASRVPAPECRSLYEKLRNGLSPGSVFADLEGTASRAVADCRRLYASEISYVDSEIGELLGALGQARSGKPEPLIVVTADHGENFGEGGLFFEHGDNVSDAGLHVPLLFTGPGVAPGRRDGSAVSLIDVAPTVLSLIGLPERGAGMDGVDLSARIRPASPGDNGPTVFAESAGALWNQAFSRLTTGRIGGRTCLNGPRFTLCRLPGQSRPALLYDRERDPDLRVDVAIDHPDELKALRRSWDRWPPESARDRAAMKGPFKLVASPRLGGGYDLALYDLDSDPGEIEDVTAGHPEVAEELARALDRWSRELPARGETLLDPKIEQALRDLGYIE